MERAGKVITVVLLGIFLLLMVDGYLSYRSEIRALDSMVHHYGVEEAQDLDDLFIQIFTDRGERYALQMIDGLSKDGDVKIRFVWLEASQESSHFPISPAKLGELASQEGRQVDYLMHQDREGRRRHLTYVEVDVGPGRTAALELDEPVRYARDAVRNLAIRMSVITGAGALLAVILVIALGHRMVGQPVEALIEKIRRVGKGDLSDPLEIQRRDEFGELAAAINSMCAQLADAKEEVERETAARIDTTDQLRHAERLHTVGRLAAGVAHELGTPLNVVSGRAQMTASGRLSAEDSKESAEIIKAETERITKTIRQLLDFARRNSPHKTRADLREVTQQVLELLNPLAEKRNYNLSLLEADTLMLAMVDVRQIQQVLTNLLVNAAQSMPAGGNIEIGFHRRRARPPDDHAAPEGDYVCVWVRDEGEGIPTENLRHIFEPFFTTKEVGQGTGLGLSIIYGIVQEHGGWIDVASEIGKGSCFSVYLPREVEP